MKTMTAEGTRMSIATNERKEFKRWVFVFFLIFFVTALVTRILPRSMRPLASSDGRKESPYEEAMHAAHNVVPYLFVLH